MRSPKICDNLFMNRRRSLLIRLMAELEQQLAAAEDLPVDLQVPISDGTSKSRIVKGLRVALADVEEQLECETASSIG